MLATTPIFLEHRLDDTMRALAADRCAALWSRLLPRRPVSAADARVGAASTAPAIRAGRLAPAR